MLVSRIPGDGVNSFEGWPPVGKLLIGERRSFSAASLRHFATPPALSTHTMHTGVKESSQTHSGVSLYNNTDHGFYLSVSMEEFGLETLSRRLSPLQHTHTSTHTYSLKLNSACRAPGHHA